MMLLSFSVAILRLPLLWSFSGILKVLWEVISNSGHATVHVQPALMVSQLRSADRSTLFYAIKIPD